MTALQLGLVLGFHPGQCHPVVRVQRGKRKSALVVQPLHGLLQLCVIDLHGLLDGSIRRRQPGLQCRVGGLQLLLVGKVGLLQRGTALNVHVRQVVPAGKVGRLRLVLLGKVLVLQSGLLREAGRLHFLLALQIAHLRSFLCRERAALRGGFGFDLANLLVQPCGDVGLLHRRLLAELRLLAFLLRRQIAYLSLFLCG